MLRVVLTLILTTYEVGFAHFMTYVHYMSEETEAPRS